ncbi:MAG: ATP-NAD kinase family protein [Halioglobus sp.]
MSGLRVGLIVNPLAGMGGSLAMKGSDGCEIQQLAQQRDHSQLSRSMQRAARALGFLYASDTNYTLYCCGGELGQQVLDSLGGAYSLSGVVEPLTGDGSDTVRAAQILAEQGVDIVVFVGGDGTARNVFDALGDSFPVLGIPAGVKMHSGVFAVSPEAAGELLVRLARGGLVGLALQEVRDIDEDAFRRDVVRARFYGEMLVPAEGQYLQQTKVGGRESSELVAADIAAWVVEEMDEHCCYLIGPGSTTAAIMAELGLDYTLLGVDVVKNGSLLCRDANEQDLLQLLIDNTGPRKIVVTVIGGQGAVFGRGNQQFSSAVIEAVGLDNIIIVAAKSKIASLEQRPLLVDTNNPALDHRLSGYRTVITGYNDQILYRLGRL